LPEEPAPGKRPRARRRFPHVFQLDEMDCGAACLGMVCRHYGRAVWTGYASVIEYGEGLEQQPEARVSLRWITPFLRPHLKLILFAVALAGLAAALELVLPILTARIFDNVIPSHDTQKLWLVTALIVVVLLAITAATLLQRYLLSVVSVRFDISSLDHLTERLLSLPMTYFSTRRTGDIERRLSGARPVRAFVTASGIQVLTSVMQLAAALALMFFWNWQLALVYLAAIPPYILLMRFSSTRLRPLYDDLEASYGRHSSGQIDAIRGIETVKALAAEDSLRRLMLGRFQTLTRRIFRTQFTVLTYQGSLQLVNLASFAVFLLVGSIEVINGGLTKGQFVAYKHPDRACERAGAVAARAVGPAPADAGAADAARRRARPGAGAKGADRSQLLPVKSLEGRVELQNVGFRYGGPGRARDPRGAHVLGGARGDDRDRGAQRVGKDDAREAPRGPDRADGGGDPVRRPRHADARLPHAAAAGRLRASGELSHQRVDRREHRVR
jgi:ABC-type transport system involved in cytochrome bd biosynthesis fused ATPase/permease subunit